jgi:hypothetical protein
MSTRSSIWLGESDGKSVRFYWELADREIGEETLRTPIYVAVDSGDSNNEVAARLPKEIAIELLTILSVNPAEDVPRVI